MYIHDIHAHRYKHHIYIYLTSCIFTLYMYILYICIYIYTFSMLWVSTHNEFHHLASTVFLHIVPGLQVHGFLWTSQQSSVAEGSKDAWIFRSTDCSLGFDTREDLGRVYLGENGSFGRFILFFSRFFLGFYISQVVVWDVWTINSIEVVVSFFFLFTPTWGRFPVWLIFFQMGGNHQPVVFSPWNQLVVWVPVIWDSRGPPK